MTNKELEKEWNASLVYKLEEKKNYKIVCKAL